MSQVRKRMVALVVPDGSIVGQRAGARNQRTLRDGITSISTQLERVRQIATVALGGSCVGGLASSAVAAAGPAVSPGKTSSTWP